MSEEFSYIYIKENKWLINKKICILGNTKTLYHKNPKYEIYEPKFGLFIFVLKVYLKDLDKILELLKKHLYEFQYNGDGCISNFYNNKIVKMIIPFLYTQNFFNQQLNEFIEKSSKNTQIQEINKLSSNNKRIESCKKIGAIVKRRGHDRETEFKSYYNSDNKSIEYGACSDDIMNINHPITKKIFNELKVESFNISIKSGKNIQFTLGNIPELKDINIEKLNNKEYVKKYF